MDPIQATSEDDLFLGQVLRKAIAIVNNVEERYREVTLPIILQHLLKGTEIANNPVRPSQHYEQRSDSYPESRTNLPSTLSVNEFFQKADAGTHVARFVCAAYYLFHIIKAEQFLQADIIEIYGKLRVKKPQNPSDVISQCIKKAYLIDVAIPINGQKSWTITSTGDKYVEGLLNGNANSKK